MQKEVNYIKCKMIQKCRNAHSEINSHQSRVTDTVPNILKNKIGGGELIGAHYV